MKICKIGRNDGTTHYWNIHETVDMTSSDGTVFSMISPDYREVSEEELQSTVDDFNEQLKLINAAKAVSEPATPEIKKEVPNVKRTATASAN
jgi:hypothetical protein